MAFDPSSLLLYLVTDASLAGERGVLHVVEACLRGGVTMVQYREKTAPDMRILEEGRAIGEACRSAGIPFIVNDRADLALALGADGVHLGREDLPVPEARKILGYDAVIGLTVETPRQAEEGSRSGADYLGASPVYFTPTKPSAGTGLGPEGIREIVAASSLPVVAIGGIKVGNAAEVMAAGCAGVAVVSALMAATDPEQAAVDLLVTLTKYRQKRRSDYGPENS